MPTRFQTDRGRQHLQDSHRHHHRSHSRPKPRAPTPPPPPPPPPRRQPPPPPPLPEESANAGTNKTLYRLAVLAREKLVKEASCGNECLLRLMGHANLLDSLIDKLEENGFTEADVDTSDDDEPALSSRDEQAAQGGGGGSLPESSKRDMDMDMQVLIGQEEDDEDKEGGGVDISISPGSESESESEDDFTDDDNDDDDDDDDDDENDKSSDSSDEIEWIDFVEPEDAHAEKGQGVNGCVSTVKPIEVAKENKPRIDEMGLGLGGLQLSDVIGNKGIAKEVDGDKRAAREVYDFGMTPDHGDMQCTEFEALFSGVSVYHYV